MTLQGQSQDTSRDAVFTLRDVSKVYTQRKISALAPTSISLARGSFTSVIGPSGCGKSTLLKIMAGVLPPSTGSITLKDKPLDGASKDIGMMFQQATLFPWRSVLENILLPIEIVHGKSKSREYRNKALDLLKLVGLEGFADAQPSELSGGMAQRAAICRMLINDPEVLLLDEPFSALDEITKDFMNIELQRICMELKATALLVTHSIADAVFLSDTIYVMSARPGRIVETVTVDLPRPRTLEMANGERFGTLVSQIRGHLDREAFK
ncbi:ABC transporter ATP-binding protein [Devosia sp. MC521]|uniref:ABC transporter ATP-binding protein n=1 Tax=Devosia sp. MC521 TaxID=2759954 RepID=UPI0015FD28CF|nr:ABC transporter ATP-binding protein [Devosia sp. MC521]MBJ6988426.1 ABC transporter ATP-binding protein [Devosia sp. MC521]QMW62471.1 ABC transporter ATP-binding protein [Devosia sp. MC521]